MWKVLAIRLHRDDVIFKGDGEAVKVEKTPVMESMMSHGVNGVQKGCSDSYWKDSWQQLTGEWISKFNSDYMIGCDDRDKIGLVKWVNGCSQLLEGSKRERERLSCEWMEHKDSLNLKQSWYWFSPEYPTFNIYNSPKGSNNVNNKQKTNL